MLAWLALFLSWGSLGLETATVVVSRLMEAGGALQGGGGELLSWAGAKGGTRNWMD